MTTLQTVELGVLGPLQVRQYGLPVTIPGAKPRAILTMLGLHGGSVVSGGTLLELLWGDDPPRTAAKALQTHISSLRRALGDGFVSTEGTGWTLSTAEIDATRYKSAAKMGRDALAAGDASQAVTRFDEALTLWRGIPELPDGARGASVKTRWIEGHAALVEDRADALLATGRAAEIIGELEAAVGEAPLRERRWGQLMLALYRAGRQGEALGAYKRARSLLADELGVDPGPDLRRLEAAIVAQDTALEIPVSQHLSAVTRAVTFLLTDIEGSTAAWEADAGSMAVALARHDEIVEQVVTSRGGRLIKTRGEGDATFSVFDRPSAAASAAIELQEAISHEPWALAEPIRIRIALHTGEVELRDGDYFGRAVNRAARLRSLATGAQILCSGATAELVIDTLSEDVILADLGMRQLRNLARPEHVFELRLQTTEESHIPPTDTPMERAGLPAVLAGSGPFVGRVRELEQLLSAWERMLVNGTRAVLIAGEPGVGKTRLAGEWCRHAYEQGAVVLYGRCDEDLGAPYQPFMESLRSLVPCLGAERLRGLRGVEALLPLVPALSEVLPDLSAPPRADPDTERYALFDAVVALLGVASTSAPVVLVLDDLHWAAKPTLLLLRHLLRFGEHARVQIVGTYRSTDLDRSHPLAAMLADLHRDGTANRLALGGLDEDDVTAYVAEAGYDDEELARALASVTGGNPFFLIEALRHVDESGGRWDPSTLPQGVREAVSRRLSRLPAETNKALAAAAVVGSRFALELVERVVGDDLVDAFDEACKAGIVIEEPGGRYRFNHALVRQSLLAELASVRRMRLHQRIAATLETEPGADDELLAELAYHYFECAWAGNASKAVDYCRRAADQAMARLAYEGAADLYGRALHALEELDDELPDRDDQQAELLVARCEALLAAGDVVSARGTVSQLQQAATDSTRLAAWGTCFDGQLSMLTDPERLDEIESALGAAAEKLAGLDDAAGEAKAHTVRAGCLARLGRIADAETALDQGLTAARRAHEHRRVNAVLAGAPLAALWGPNPVPRAGGRCLDVVRLLRITTGSPVVEATSTRCQGVLDAFRGRAAAGRQLIDSARRSLTELGMRHALLEVEQFAGLVELVADEPASAELHLRKAYNGFRRMGLDADTAETAALLARACLALDRDAEANELCTESERLAGHALKASIVWRTVRAQLLARSGAHEEARRVAGEAVEMTERTDALVDHGDACLALATVLGVAGDAAGARAAAERAVSAYELKGAAALAEGARKLLGNSGFRAASAPSEPPKVELDNACVQAISRLDNAFERGAWDEVGQLMSTEVSIESRRKIVGFPRGETSFKEWLSQAKQYRTIGGARNRNSILAVRGERLALTRLKIGTTDVSAGAPQDEMLQVLGLDGQGRIESEVFFDIEDIDAAMAELEAAHAGLENQRLRVSLENSASRADHRLNELCADRRWGEFGSVTTDDIRIEDRRSGLRSEHNGRASLLTEAQTIGDLGTESVTSDVLATRGERLALVRILFLGWDTRPDAFRTELLRIVEVDADKRIVAYVVFDPNDFDAALEELDARYLAGDAAAHAHTWSVIAESCASVSRREQPATTPDCVNIDHRRGAGFAPGDLVAYLRTGSDLDQLVGPYIEAVHRLSNHGAVIAYAAHGTSPKGFDAEWREISISMVDGDLISRCEVFDEADLDAALARFDELGRPAPRLENAASRMYDRFNAYLAARDWDAMTQMIADDVCNDDRRRVVSGGLQRGRDAQIANLRAVVDVGVKNIDAVVIATRGDRVALTRARVSGGDQRAEAFGVEMLSIVEVHADNRIAAGVIFDPDDLDAAFQELDARYLTGEAAVHAQTWSVLASSFAAFNRHEVPTADWVTIDHRRATPFEPSDMTPSIRTIWNLTPDLSIHIETVHRLSNSGAVITHTGGGASQEGFDAEWRAIDLLMVEGDRIIRCEVFDEADIDTAIARFEELSRPGQQSQNAASRAIERFLVYFAAADWDAIADTFAADYSYYDRRRVVNAGMRQGRTAAVEDLQAAAAVGITDATSTVIATRGSQLALTRSHWSVADQRPEPFRMDVLQVTEVDSDERVVASVAFDPGDLDAAYEELDARYLAGEAAPSSRTWQLVLDAVRELNRHETGPILARFLATDHRRLPFAPGDFQRGAEDLWELVPDARYRVSAVHRLEVGGAVISLVIEGTDTRGTELQWVRIISWETAQWRAEIYEEDDLDTALARFAELCSPLARLENAASRFVERYYVHFAARDWDAMVGLVADDIRTEDRRRVVNAGVLQGRVAEMANLRAVADIGTENITSTVVAIRGERLVLTASSFAVRDWPEGFRNVTTDVVEINADNQVSAHIMFDPDDIDAAFAELEARYIAGEAAAHAHTWSVIAEGHAAFNRRELPATPPQLIDHRPLVTLEAGDPTANVREMWHFTPDLRIYIEAVHRLSDLGAVFTQVSHGTSQAGFDGEWRIVELVSVEGNQINRGELFEGADVDTAIARFEQLSRPVRRLQNAATHQYERLWKSFDERDWDAITEMFATDIASDDRRRVVNAGPQQGRDVQIADMRSLAEIGANVTSTVMAIRGERLLLAHITSLNRDLRHGEFAAEMLVIIEIDSDSRISAGVLFDIDDIDAAFEELDARYQTGEAAAHANTWSLVTKAFASVNRRELAAMTPDWEFVDHRRLAMVESKTMAASFRVGWELAPQASIYIETVHRLSDLGAVTTHSLRATSHEGFDAEWRSIDLLTFNGDLLNRSEIFDEADVDAALARFDELHYEASRLENAATRIDGQFEQYFAARAWAALTELFADDTIADDRRRVMGGAILRGRQANIANIRAIAELGTATVTSMVIATRGDRLVLSRYRFSGRDSRPDAFHTEVLCVMELNPDERIAGRVLFDLDDVDAAFDELDARYVAGEGAAHSHTWSVVARSFDAVNRHEFPDFAPDFVNIDHRQAIAFAPGEMTAYIHATLNDAPDLRIYIEAVHQLSSLGVVATHVAHNTSQQGFEAEWRLINISTVQGDMINRCELFDETDIDAALTRFDELSRLTPPLENAATRVCNRWLTQYAARDWDAIRQILADDVCNDDRRRVVSSGTRHGRDLDIADMRATADIGVTNLTSTVIATRGERLGLSRYRFSGRDSRPAAFHAEMFGVVEINADNQIAARIWFDLEDIGAAFEELDARFLAGEAGPYSSTWSVVAEAHAALNRRELPSTTPDWANDDHRRGTAFGPGDLFAYIRTAWDLMPDVSGHIASVHRLSNLGAVVTQAIYGTSQEGFDAEWRQINLLTVEGDLISRIELFDDENIASALARFDELGRQAPRVENAASQVGEHVQALFVARNWVALAEILDDDILVDDRRRIVSAPLLRGRDVEIANMQAFIDVGITNVTSTVIATRGERLALSRRRFSGRDHGPEAFYADIFDIVEINADKRFVAHVVWDANDIDVAFEELDARYLAGEAAAHAHTWSVIAAANSAFNQEELSAADLAFIDHRRGTPFASGELTAAMFASWRLTPKHSSHFEAVHRLSDLGAVVTNQSYGTSPEGFDAEWRMIQLLSVEGDRINRCELFDEADLDAALARFEELTRPAQQLENAASQVNNRYDASFAARDWDAMADLLIDDTLTDDRRRVVNGGVRHGREAEVASMRGVADIGVTNATSVVIATRGQRLALLRTRFPALDQGPEAFHLDIVDIVEIDADKRIKARIAFDPNDIDAAFAELDVLYLAGEAAGNVNTWSVVTRAYAAFNRGEMFPTSPDWVNFDHRRGTPFAPGEMTAYLRAIWDVTPEENVYIEAVHRLSSIGSVVTHAANWTSQEGFAAEWRVVDLLTVQGDLITRVEFFDESDIDAALSKFDELNRSVPRLVNTASAVSRRFWSHFANRDWAALTEATADDIFTEDRRRVVNAGARHGRDADMANLRAMAELGGNATSTAIAIRGERLVLSRLLMLVHRDDGSEAFRAEGLGLTEIDAENRLVARIVFDIDDVETAFKELDARYLAGEAAVHAHTWSVIAAGYAALNRHEVPPTTQGWVSIDHRRGIAFAPGDLAPYIRATFDVAPNVSIHIEAVHRLSNLGAVITQVVHGTSAEGFDAEWREIVLFTVDGDLVDRCEMFDEEDLDNALARFDELNQQVPQLDNAATRAQTRIADAFNRRDLDGFLAIHDGRYEDRRTGLRNEGTVGRKFAEAVLSEAAESWRMEIQPIAIRGSRFALTRTSFRDTDDTDDTDRPIAVETLMFTEVNDNELVSYTVAFDPDDIDGAFGELTARWIASGEVAHPEVVESVCRFNEISNRHDWDAITAGLADAAYVSHRQLAHAPAETIDDYMSSIRMMASLVPDYWTEFAEILTHSAKGLVASTIVKGTSTDGVPIEIPIIHLIGLDGDRVTRVEFFDEDQRDLALARFKELNY